MAQEERTKKYPKNRIIQKRATKVSSQRPAADCRHPQKAVVYCHIPDSPLPAPLLGLEHILVVGVPFLVPGRRPLVVGQLLVAVPTVLVAVPFVLAGERLPLEQLH